ncbi:MAG: DUF5985 family protein [Pseudobdellovibrionaceae bacterium]
MVDAFTTFLSGATFLGFFISGVLFLKFWIRSQDRLFATFSVSFFLMALERILVLKFVPYEETHALVYVLRLIAFVLISGAVVDKNRVRSQNHEPLPQT